MKLTAVLAAAVACLVAVAPARADLDLFAVTEYVPQEVLDGFTRETGIKVNLQTYSTNEEMATKLATGASNYDLIQPSDYKVESLVQKGKLAEIDWSKVPNIRNIDPALLDLPFDPGHKHSVPYMTGTVGIIVNTDVVKDEIKGYADVFQPKHKGRIVAVADNREIFTWAMEAKGLPINTVNKGVVEQVQPTLEQWLPMVKVFDSDSPSTPMLGGDTDLGVVWCGDAARCIQQDKKFKYVLPAEGAHEFIDNLCIPANAAHKAEAMRFIDYVLRPEVSKKISDKFPYTNPNLEARKLLSPEQLANPASYPKPQTFERFRAIGKANALIDKLIGGLRNIK